MEMQLQTKDTLATLHLDPRTKLYLLIVGNVALFLAPSLLYEIALVVCVVILGILVGAKRFTVRMAAVLYLSDPRAAGWSFSGMADLFMFLGM